MLYAGCWALDAGQGWAGLSGLTDARRTSRALQCTPSHAKITCNKGTEPRAAAAAAVAAV